MSRVKAYIITSAKKNKKYPQKLQQNEENLLNMCTESMWVKIQNMNYITGGGGLHKMVNQP